LWRRCLAVHFGSPSLSGVSAWSHERVAVVECLPPAICTPSLTVRAVLPTGPRGMLDFLKIAFLADISNCFANSRKNGAYQCNERHPVCVTSVRISLVLLRCPHHPVHPSDFFLLHQYSHNWSMPRNVVTVDTIGTVQTYACAICLCPCLCMSVFMSVYVSLCAYDTYSDSQQALTRLADEQLSKHVPRHVMPTKMLRRGSHGTAQSWKKEADEGKEETIQRRRSTRQGSSASADILHAWSNCV